MPTSSTVATTTKKTATPRKTTKAKAKPVTGDRSHATWLVRDDKLLVASLELDIYTIATLLQRAPLTVLQRLLESRVMDALNLQGLGFEFEQGSEEQAELYGLTLCGVPLAKTLQWCLARQDRPTTAQLTAMMTTADFRPAMYMARDMRICFSDIGQIDDLRSLEQEWPLEIVQAGVEDVIARFDVPTGASVLAVLNGEPPERARPYKYFDQNASFTVTRNNPLRTHYRKRARKSKSSNASSTAWKPYRKSRRSYGSKRSYA